MGTCRRRPGQGKSPTVSPHAYPPHPASQLLFLSDPNAKFASELGLAVDLSAVGFGMRTGRWALVIDDLKVTYVGVEEKQGVTVSGADAVLAKL